MLLMPMVPMRCRLRIKKAYLQLTDKRRASSYGARLARLSEYEKWVDAGRLVPPPHILKQLIVRANAEAYGIKTLIETGTYLGEMVDAMSDHFDKIISIELSDELHASAKRKFEVFPHVNILKGDSAQLLPSILKDLREPALFWLDGHFSGGNTAKGELETPILTEIRSIAQHHIPDHVILVDDARLFTGKDDYPSVESVIRYAQEWSKDYQMQTFDDILFLRKNGGIFRNSSHPELLRFMERDLWNF